MAPALLGPPVIRGARPTLAAADADAEAPASHPFLDLLDASFNDDGPAALRSVRTGPWSAPLARTRRRAASCSAPVSWPRPPLLALPLLLTGRSIPARGERRGEERSSEREVAGEELSPAVVAARIAVVEEAESERESVNDRDERERGGSRQF